MKKRGGKKKEKKVKKKTAISELETLTYEKEILEKNRQLARLKSRNEELETDAENLKEKFKKSEENKADLTSYLQRALERKSEQVQELNERLIALEQLRKDEQLAFAKKEESMELEYKKMETSLTAEIKLAAGKLTALEDFRLARIELMKNFEDQEKRMSEQEIRHREILYETEKKFIIGKEKMQSELEKRLTELADSFRDATKLRLADATQRAVQENVSLHLELNQLLKHCRELDNKVQDCQERERNARLEASLREAEARLALNKVTKQNRTIEHYAIEYKRMSQEILRSIRAEEYVKLGKKLIEDSERSCVDADHKARLLEQNVEISRNEKDEAMRDVDLNCREIDRLSRILGQAKNCIREALQVQAELGDNNEEEEEEEEPCSTCFVDVKEKLLHSLLDILAGYQDSSTGYEESTITESEPVENVYQFGNLGLIPYGAKLKIDKPAESLQESAEENTRSFIATDCSCDK